MSDAVSTTPGDSHQQTFNAIDRFTGGAAEQKLYEANAASSQELAGDVYLESDRLPAGDWWKGLLVLVVRDLLEGDMAIGWGKARGYGAFKVRLELADGPPIDTWQGFLKYLKGMQQQPKIQSWITALHNQLDKNHTPLAQGTQHA